jgi:hypothetical protein
LYAVVEFSSEELSSQGNFLTSVGGIQNVDIHLHVFMGTSDNFE